MEAEKPKRVLAHDLKTVTLSDKLEVCGTNPGIGVCVYIHKYTHTHITFLVSILGFKPLRVPSSGLGRFWG